MPTFPGLPALAIWELTPTTRPLESSSGPPELPGLIGASVWMTSSIWKPFGARISRPTPDTIPAVAVRSSPNGWPMATTASPTWTSSEFASGSARSPPACFGSTRTTARSDETSLPRTRASSRLPRSPNFTCVVLAAPTTCALVTMVPSRPTTNPVPDAVPPERRAWTDTTPGPAAAYTRPTSVRPRQPCSGGSGGADGSAPRSSPPPIRLPSSAAPMRAHTATPMTAARRTVSPLLGGAGLSGGDPCVLVAPAPTRSRPAGGSSWSRAVRLALRAQSVRGRLMLAPYAAVRHQRIKPRTLTPHAKLDRGRGGQEHGEPRAWVARRGALLPEHEGRPRLPRVKLRGQLGGNLSRHPADLLAAARRVYGDGVGVVGVVRVAPQDEILAGRDGVGLKRFGMVLRRARHAGDAQPALAEHRRIAREVAARLRIDELISHQPDDPSELRIPVPLLVADVDDHTHQCRFTP